MNAFLLLGCCSYRGLCNSCVRARDGAWSISRSSVVPASSPARVLCPISFSPTHSLLPTRPATPRPLRSHPPLTHIHTLNAHTQHLPRIPLSQLSFSHLSAPLSLPRPHAPHAPNLRLPWISPTSLHLASVDCAMLWIEDPLTAVRVSQRVCGYPCVGVNPGRIRS
jgi:hypothetical protein